MQKYLLSTYYLMLETLRWMTRPHVHRVHNLVCEACVCKHMTPKNVYEVDGHVQDELIHFTWRVL